MEHTTVSIEMIVKLVTSGVDFPHLAQTVLMSNAILTLTIATAGRVGGMARRLTPTKGGLSFDRRFIFHYSLVQ